MIRNWALHKCPDNIKIGELGKSLVDGSSSNPYFPAIEPFYLHCRPLIAKAGMSRSDMLGTPLDFSENKPWKW